MEIKIQEKSKKHSKAKSERPSLREDGVILFQDTAPPKRKHRISFQDKVFLQSIFRKKTRSKSFSIEKHFRKREHKRRSLFNQFKPIPQEFLIQRKPIMFSLKLNKCDVSTKNRESKIEKRINDKRNLRKKRRHSLLNQRKSLEIQKVGLSSFDSSLEFDRITDTCRPQIDHSKEQTKDPSLLKTYRIKTFKRKNCVIRSRSLDEEKFESLSDENFNQIPNTNTKTKEKINNGQFQSDMKSPQKAMKFEKYFKFDSIPSQIVIKRKHIDKKNFSIKRKKKGKQPLNLTDISLQILDVTNRSKPKKKRKQSKIRTIHPFPKARRHFHRHSLDYDFLNSRAKQNPIQFIGSLKVKMNSKSKPRKRHSMGLKKNIRHHPRKKARQSKQNPPKKKPFSKIIKKTSLSKILQTSFEGFENSEHHFQTRKQVAILPKLFFKIKKSKLKQNQNKTNYVN